jgi:hypothetical protein
MDENLAFFRVEIEMALETELEIEPDDEASPQAANGYYRLFGVTASSYAEAVAFVEETLADIVTEEPEISGWLVQLQVDTWTEPTGADDEEYLQDPSLRGVHFISEPAFFLALDKESVTQELD